MQHHCHIQNRAEVCETMNCKKITVGEHSFEISDISIGEYKTFLVACRRTFAERSLGNTENLLDVSVDIVFHSMKRASPEFQRESLDVLTQEELSEILKEIFVLSTPSVQFLPPQRAN